MQIVCIRVELLMLNNNIWKHLTVCKQMSSDIKIKLPTNYSLTNRKYKTEFGII